VRTYIFTQKELSALQEFLKTQKRNPTVNKLLHYIRHNDRLLTDLQILLILMGLARRKPLSKSKPKGLPGRPPKIFERFK